MSIRQNTPCDYGECPYCAEYSHDCEYWCGAEEPELTAFDCGEDREEDYSDCAEIATITITYSCGEDEMYCTAHSEEEAYWRMKAILADGGVILNLTDDFIKED